MPTDGHRAKQDGSLLAASYDASASGFPGVGGGDALVKMRFKTYWLLNEDTGEIFPLGPMYGGTVDYARRKLEAEGLPYQWRLLAPVAEKTRV